MAKSKPRATMNRLTHERVGDITKTGYWTAAKKQELIDALAAYEDTGKTAEEVAELAAICERQQTKLQGFAESYEPAKSKHIARLKQMAQLPGELEAYAKEFKEKLMVEAAGNKVETIRSRAAGMAADELVTWLQLRVEQLMAEEDQG